MQRRKLGLAALLIGAAMMAAGQIAGNFAEEAATAGGQAAWQAALDHAVFSFYALSFPLGLGLAAVGVALAAGLVLRRMIWLGLGCALAIWLISPANLVQIREPAPLFFGIGGNLIAFMLLLSLWFWARARPKLEGRAGLAADFRLLGLVFLGAGAWTVCGLGAFPVYGIQPDKANLYQTLAIAKETFADVMVYLLLGFFFTMLGQWAGKRTRRWAGDS